MNPADIRALLAVLLRGQDIDMQSSAVATQERSYINTATFDTYLAEAQQILESSWNPNNYKHPAGEDFSQQSVEGAISLLQSKGYTVMQISSPSSSSVSSS